MVFFQRADGSEKKYLPSRIPDCETVFAMTIHKSQGSEFEEVLIALPDVVNPVLTKELLYTAVTRAKKTIRVVAGETVFKMAVRQKVTRVTGLVNQFRSGIGTLPPSVRRNRPAADNCASIKRSGYFHAFVNEWWPAK
jgi:exodeoxyribonuclease V alpha subunit